jgi:hypothetical protein
LHAGDEAQQAQHVTPARPRCGARPSPSQQTGPDLAPAAVRARHTQHDTVRTPLPATQVTARRHGPRAPAQLAPHHRHTRQQLPAMTFPRHNWLGHGLQQPAHPAARAGPQQCVKRLHKALLHILLRVMPHEARHLRRGGWGWHVLWELPLAAVALLQGLPAAFEEAQRRLSRITVHAEAHVAASDCRGRRCAEGGGVRGLG